jgi:hypothetical protein
MTGRSLILTVNTMSCDLQLELGSAHSCQIARVSAILVLPVFPRIFRYLQYSYFGNDQYLLVLQMLENSGRYWNTSIYQYLYQYCRCWKILVKYWYSPFRIRKRLHCDFWFIFTTDGEYVLLIYLLIAIFSDWKHRWRNTIYIQEIINLLSISMELLLS